jgi:uncharacterized protein YukE
MANKVNNSTAQNKWDSLKGSAGVSLSHIVQGKASSSDFQRVQSILNQQSSLASQIFKQAVSTAEAQAKKFQDSYQAVLDKDNKELLSAFEVALNAELQKVTPDIVGQLKEIIEISSASNRDDIDKSMGARFEQFREFLPKEKDVPTIKDMLDANSRLAAEVHSDAQVRWERDQPQLLEKIANVFQTTLRNLADAINREKAQRAPTPPGGNISAAHALPGHESLPLLGHAPQVVDERPSILSQGMALLHDPGSSGSASAAQGQPGSERSSGNASTMVVALSPAAQRELTTAAEAQKDFYERMKELLPGGGQATKGEAEEEGDEEKRADTWWRSFKNWFGDDESSSRSKKKSDKSDFGWLKTLGSALALMVLNPKLFQTIGEEIKKFLSWDNLSKSFDAAWKWVSEQASSIIDSIEKMLSIENLKKAAESLWGFIKKSASAIGGWIKKLLGGDDDADSSTSPSPTGTDKDGAASVAPGTSKGGKDAKKGSAPGILSKASTAISNFFGFGDKSGDTKTANNNTSVANANGSSTSNSTVVNSTMTAGKGRSSVGAAPASDAALTAAASTFAESPGVKNSPGVSLLPGGSAAGGSAGGAAAMQPQKGAPQIGISSFGFNAANSDSLLLMNTYHFTGG